MYDMSRNSPRVSDDFDEHQTEAFCLMGFRSETQNLVASSVIDPCALCGRAPTVVALIYVLQDNCFTFDFRALKAYTFECTRRAYRVESFKLVLTTLIVAALQENRVTFP